MPWLYRRLAVPPNPFRTDPRLEALVLKLVRGLGLRERALNLGSGSTDYGPRVVNVDIAPFPGLHVCGDAHRLPFAEGVFQGVFLRGVLEHVRSAEEVRSEIDRVLAPGGYLYVEVPFLQPYHLSPEDYRRFTLPGLRSFLPEFDEIESGVQIGPGSTLAWILRESVASLLSFGSLRLYRKILALSGWLTFWVRYLDKIVVYAPHVNHAASAVYFLGRKSERELSPPGVREMSPQLAAAQ